jgi:formyl-CoA transferase
VGFQIGDLAGGLYAAIGVLAALQHRAQTGFGSEVDISLLDSQIALLADDVTYSSINTENPVRWGTGHPYLAPYQAFETLDGAIVVAAVGHEAFWKGLCRAIGTQNLMDDDRFFSNAARVANRDALIPLLAKIFLSEGQQHWLETLQLHDVPCAPILSVGESLALDVSKRRAMVRSVDGYERDLSVAGNPVKFVGAKPPGNAKPAPQRGGDSRNLLLEIGGYSEDEIDQMCREAVIYCCVNDTNRSNK